jgi:glutamyl-tRNA synthetase
LYRALEISERIPSYLHVPLVVGIDGRRLAKRHGDTRLSYYRELGVTAGRVLALLARWCGIEVREDVTARELFGRFDLSRVPKSAILFGNEDDAELRGAL